MLVGKNRMDDFMNRKVLILLLLFLFCGCSASYNIDIDDDFISEHVTAEKGDNDVILSIVDTDSFSSFEAAVDNYFENPLPLYYSLDIDKKFYKISRDDNSNLYKISLDGDFNFDDYYDSNIANFGCNNFKVEIDDDIIELSAYDFKVFNFTDSFDNLEVNINTKYKVVKNNADLVDGNKYTWKFDKNNYQDKYILIRLKRNIFDKVNKKSVLGGLFVIVVLIFFIVFIIIHIKNSFKNNNKID